MTGTEQDWMMLKEKTLKLKILLTPILEEIQLKSWFQIILEMIEKLLQTYSGYKSMT